ncbi:MAG: hypothetical protein Fur0011_6180 [Candidatus Microgenomates bacterium]
MTKLSSLSIFVPTYNEEANISLVIEDVLKYVPSLANKWELIVINDGSIDQTARIAKSYSERYSEIRLINHARNRGYGAAVKTGLRAARYDWIFFTDSDRQFRFDELASFIAHRDSADFVIGYRKKRRDNFIRTIIAQGFLRLWNYLLFGLTVKDVDCAYKLIPKKCLNKLSLTTASAITVTELIYKLTKKGYRYLEVPVTHYPRPYGHQTGNHPSVMYKALRESVTLWQSL